MRRLLAKLCLICLGVLSSTARGQAIAPAVAHVNWPSESTPPVLTVAWVSPAANSGAAPVAAPPSRRVAVARAEEVAPGPAAPNAAPPADPLPPAWGNYGQPQPVPVALPPVEFTLVGPPRGVIQPNSGQDYRAVVANPDGVPNNDIGLTQPIDLNRPDGLAPSGVFGAVTLPAGRTMVSYGYLLNVFQGNLVGAHQVSTGSVLGQYSFAPRKSLQDSQVATVTYGVTDDLTITGSLPFEHNQIDYAQVGGGNLHTGFTNPGDIRLSALYVLRRSERQQWHLNFGISFPVGMLETLSDMPSPVIPNLPYVLRTSSGTYDLLPGYTYRGQTDRWSWGVQASGVIRLGFNTLGYKLGDRADATGWLARRWTEQLSTSARFDSQIWANAGGLDSRLVQTLAPTNRTDLQAGKRIDLLFGINYYLPATRIPGQYLTIESGFPVYQSLTGPQLGLDWILNAGWTMAW